MYRFNLSFPDRTKSRQENEETQYSLGLDLVDWS